MLDENAFEELVRQIQEQGFDEETAGRYAVLIGDMPVTDEQGRICVMSGGEIIARLKPLKMFEAR